MTERAGTARTAAPVVDDDVEPPRLDRRRALDAFDFAALATIGVAVVYGLLWSVIQLHLGLIAVAVMGGWIIGGAVARGAWRKERHFPDIRLRAMAAAFGLLAWIGGAAVGYVLGQVLLPEAVTPVTARISFGGFADYLVGVYDLVHGIALATLVYFSWRSAR
jgi:hypothetical protein